MKKIINLTLLLIYSTLFSYELPSINIVGENSTKPQIIFFTSQSVLVGEKQSVLLKWETENATKVTINKFYEMDLDGNITVTKEEFDKGSVTLEASSDKSKDTDKITLNGKEEIFDEVNPIPRNGRTESPAMYNTIPRRYGLPYRRYPNGYNRNMRNIH